MFAEQKLSIETISQLRSIKVRHAIALMLTFDCP
jgi:hypothetical protein